ncbi:MAG: cytoplasmic protein [SAR324 cluster bacterium]|nr:cytoplasmic protein [SAR324 cluster bacterium]
MRHLLIILISILLLSSPVIGDNHKGETLYGWGKCCDYVWKGFGDKETHSKYKGDVENGVPNGLGILILPNGNKYVGGWKDGRWNGQGTFTTSNGSKYEGEWKNGPGTHTYPDGSKYEGEYKDDWEWNGTQYDKNGNIIFNVENGKDIKQ